MAVDLLSTVAVYRSRPLLTAAVNFRPPRSTYLAISTAVVNFRSGRPPKIMAAAGVPLPQMQYMYIINISHSVANVPKHNTKWSCNYRYGLRNVGKLKDNTAYSRAYIMLDKQPGCNSNCNRAEVTRRDQASNQTRVKSNPIT